MRGLEEFWAGFNQPKAARMKVAEIENDTFFFLLPSQLPLEKNGRGRGGSEGVPRIGQQQQQK